MSKNALMERQCKTRQYKNCIDKNCNSERACFSSTFISCIVFPLSHIHGAEENL